MCNARKTYLTVVFSWTAQCCSSFSAASAMCCACLKWEHSSFAVLAVLHFSNLNCITCAAVSQPVIRLASVHCVVSVSMPLLDRQTTPKHYVHCSSTVFCFHHFPPYMWTVGTLMTKCIVTCDVSLLTLITTCINFTDMQTFCQLSATFISKESATDH